MYKLRDIASYGSPFFSLICAFLYEKGQVYLLKQPQGLYQSSMNNSFRNSNRLNQSHQSQNLNNSYSYSLNNQNQKNGNRNNYSFNQGFSQYQNDQTLSYLGWDQTSTHNQHAKSKNNNNTSWDKRQNSSHNHSREQYSQIHPNPSPNVNKSISQSHQNNQSMGQFDLSHSFENNYGSLPRGPQQYESYSNMYDSYQQSGHFGNKGRQGFGSDAMSSGGKSSQSRKSTKVKVPTVKQDSSNEFYFPTIIETTDYATCPFNPQHIMEPDRLLNHISKCRLKSQNSHFYSQCPYQPCHYVYTSELAAHQLSCNKRHLFVVSDWDEVKDLPVQQVEIDANENNPLNQSNYLDETAFTVRKAPSSVNEEKQKFEDFLIDP